MSRQAISTWLPRKHPFRVLPPYNHYHPESIHTDWVDITISTPLLRIVTSLPLLAAFVLLPATAVVVTGPGGSDQYALIGAVVAAVITLVGVRKFDQSAPNSVCAVLGAITGGVAFPGAIVSWAQWKGLVDTHTYPYITWHMWTIMGLLCGLTGWVASQSVYQTLNKIIPGITTWCGNKITKFFTSPDK